MTTRRLAIVAFHYPPDNTSTGVLRTLKFTQYLVEHGWQTDVISVPERLYGSVDPSSLADVPPTTRIFRPWAADVKRLFGFHGAYPALLAIPDRYWPWVIPAFRQAAKLVRAREVSAVMTTYPVPSAHLVGWLVKRRFHIPWLADFRDPWVEGSMTRWRQRVEGAMERAVLRQADRIICNTPRMRSSFLERYPDLAEEKFITIPNGYDQKDLLRVIPEYKDKFEILYTGIIAPGNRNPRPLLAGVRYALDRGWLRRNDLLITFLGAGYYSKHPDFQHDLDRYQLRELTTVVYERIPYQKALNRMAGANVVTILSEPLGDDDKARAERAWSHLQVPAKVYECLGLGRPMLALVTDGAVRDLIEEVGAGEIADPTRPEVVASALKRIYDAHCTGRVEGRLEGFQTYSRQNQAKQLAQALRQSIGHET